MLRITKNLIMVVYNLNWPSNTFTPTSDRIFDRPTLNLCLNLFKIAATNLVLPHQHHNYMYDTIFLLLSDTYLNYLNDAVDC